VGDDNWVSHPRWHLCESAVIPFRVPRRKVWLTTAAGMPCSNAANIEERKTWTNVNFAPGKIPSGGSRKCLLPAIVQSLVGVTSNVAAVTKLTRETR